MSTIKFLTDRHEEVSTRMALTIGELLLAEEKKDKFVAETDPKTYGSNAEQREAYLALHFPDCKRAKKEIEIFKLDLSDIEFKTKLIQQFPFEFMDIAVSLKEQTELPSLETQEGIVSE